MLVDEFHTGVVVNTVIGLNPFSQRRWTRLSVKIKNKSGKVLRKNNKVLRTRISVGIGVSTRRNGEIFVKFRGPIGWEPPAEIDIVCVNVLLVCGVELLLRSRRRVPMFVSELRCAFRTARMVLHSRPIEGQAKDEKTKKKKNPQTKDVPYGSHGARARGRVIYYREREGQIKGEFRFWP